MSEGRPGETHVTDADLAELDRLVEEALASGREERLAVLGYGEISLVLGWPLEAPAFACKRLPVFGERARFDAYGATLDDYLGALRSAGVRVVDTELRGVEQDGDSIAGYVVQPMLPAEELAPVVLARHDPGAGHPLVAVIADTAVATVGPRLGLDSQLANWIWEDERLIYIDVSTPMLWSADGRPRLDVELMTRAIPWALRGAVRRFVAPGIVDTYRDLRKVYLDLCGNLIKEGLEAWLPVFLEQVNHHLDEPLTADDVQRYYRSDRRLWAALLRIRRLDRTWQRRVRRRPYPFLLPRQITR